ncbi:sulfatase-like hydrolase/transferase [Pontiella sp. NLcol2]|uniref:Sulfatase-like hydrolase/transferase n=2 Tax=Pontiella agarivorans TaxID=3038953 RepID=A0ABU5MY52_9BACT|nr:sulfatase-like hydrolase/transferase [Pontiella agarivorans]
MPPCLDDSITEDTDTFKAHLKTSLTVKEKNHQSIPTKTKQQRPNVVWLTSEDNSACWYRLYNTEHGAPMPNIERLAKHGIVFNHAYSCGPVCSVARSTIISGCHGPRTGAQHHRSQISAKMPKGLKLFPYYLRQAGYYTTNNSKEDYNYSSADKKGVWDESVMLIESKGDGDAFGRKNKVQIAKLIDIADLQLHPFPEARNQLAKALYSSQPQERYWGLISCAVFGTQATPFYETAKQLAASDPYGLVRVRAAEFLGLVEVADPMPVIYDVLNKTTDPIEVNLILNSVVLLRDAAGVQVDPSVIKNAEWAALSPLVKSRATYLTQ